MCYILLFAPLGDDRKSREAEPHAREVHRSCYTNGARQPENTESMVEYYLTFDLGTTALKTALVSDEGRLAAVHVEEYTPASPRPDWLEMSPDAYWQAAVVGTRAVLSVAGVDPAHLAAIGFSSQGQTYIPIDRAGQPLYPAIVWVDNRAQAIADAWEAAWLSKDEYRRISGYPWLPAGLTVFKVAWMREHAPEALRAWKFLCLPDYLIYRMTGETVTDFVIAQMTGMYDLQSQAWEPRLLDAAGITAAQLPAVRAPGTVAGQVNTTASLALGIPAGIPVCLGANDQLVGGVGAGNVQPGIVTETTGTSLALIATTESVMDDNRVFVSRHAVPNLGYAMAFTVTSAIVLKWFRDLCASGEDYATFLAGVEGVAPGCDGLSVLPHFAGTATPTYNPHVHGAFAGLALGHTRAHLARAIMESCACMLQECLDCITGHGQSLTSVRSLGGAARSDVWLQVKADLLGVPVERPACSDAASLGAAMLAAAGIGRFAGVAEASRAWYRPDRTFHPDPARFSVYREVYGRYLNLYNRMYGE